MGSSPGQAAPRPIAANVPLVDDDPDLLEVRADMLHQRGYCVTTATSGPKALTALEMRQAIVMLEQAMPTMTGLRRHARQWVRLANHPGHRTCRID
jgi:CheY-like chemotaxis protein